MFSDIDFKKCIISEYAHKIISIDINTKVKHMTYGPIIGYTVRHGKFKSRYEYTVILDYK
jgi:hypothetical protein